MHLERLPRRLWYRWLDGGAETEYPTDIPTPIPEIKCDEITVQIPPSLPNTFTLFGLNVDTGQYVSMGIGAFSLTFPSIGSTPGGVYKGFNLCFPSITYTDSLGISRTIGSGFRALCGSFILSPGSINATRRDLLVGSERVINPTVNTPCPKWRFTGGNCPPTSLDCGNCCLDCASVVAGIEGVTSAVLPISTWRKRL